MMSEIDLNKVAINQEKHGLLMRFWCSMRQTCWRYSQPHQSEDRLVDIALVDEAGVVLVLVYVMCQSNKMRAISSAAHQNRKGPCMQKIATNPTGIDWERAGPHDPNDAAAAPCWQQASPRGRGRPPVAIKRPTLNMRVDADVLSAFKATGPGWQTRINAVLRGAVANGLVKT